MSGGSSTGGGKPPRVLFLDDETDIVSAFDLTLGMMGFDCDGFTNPARALERFAQGPQDFDFVVTDFTLPHMTCAEFVSRLRDIRGDIPIHLCTGNAEHEIKEAATELGISHVLFKPFDFNGLEAFISRAAGRGN